MSKHTKQDILNAAEALFAEHGFVNTSMRMITQSANVNLAAVNYHFGSKKNLIQAVLQRYFDLAIPLIDSNLDNWLASQEKTSDSLIASLANPLIKLELNKPDSAVLFVQLLGRGYSESQGHLRRFITQHYGATIEKMLNAFQVLIPEISREELFWRLHFALGSCVFTLSSKRALADISESDFAQQASVDVIIKRLSAFIAAGIDN